MAAISALAGLLPADVAAQAFPAVGTRAAGMGGAFVGVADDATAIYWNPAGLAVGSYFSLVLDGGTGEVSPNGSLRGGDSSSLFLGLAMPALGLGYYRLQATNVAPRGALLTGGQALLTPPFAAVSELQIDTLITHHAGISLVQSLLEGVAVGTTLKLVRGFAASSIVPGATADEALRSEAAELFGKASNKFDFDIGVMASGGPLKVGLTLRNVLEPEFEAAGGGRLTQDRQARAGLSFAVSTNWLAAADFDLLRTTDTFGERRDIALGVEGRPASRLLVRTGFSLNTVDDNGDIDGSARKAYSVGASYAARASVYIDGHFTTGNDRAGRQWGLSARFLY